VTGLVVVVMGINANSYTKVQQVQDVPGEIIGSVHVQDPEGNEKADHTLRIEADQEEVEVEIEDIMEAKRLRKKVEEILRKKVGEVLIDRILLDVLRKKVDILHVDILHVDVLHVDVLHVEVPHVDVPHVEVPHVDVPHVEVPHVEVPHAEVPHAEVPHAEVPHAEVLHAEIPHADAPSPLLLVAIHVQVIALVLSLVNAYMDLFFSKQLFLIG